MINCTALLRNGPKDKLHKNAHVYRKTDRLAAAVYIDHNKKEGRDKANRIPCNLIILITSCRFIMLFCYGPLLLCWQNHISASDQMRLKLLAPGLSMASAHEHTGRFAQTHTRRHTRAL